MITATISIRPHPAVSGGEQQGRGKHAGGDRRPVGTLSFSYLSVWVDQRSRRGTLQPNVVWCSTSQKHPQSLESAINNQLAPAYRGFALAPSLTPRTHRHIPQISLWRGCIRLRIAYQSGWAWRRQHLAGGTV